MRSGHAFWVGKKRAYKIKTQRACCTHIQSMGKYPMQPYMEESKDHETYTCQGSEIT